MKSTFLEQQRDILGYLRGLSQDSYVVICKVLEVCWVGLWSHPKVKWTAKIKLFSEITIHLLKLHELAVAENADGDHIPANLVRHFLAICTRPGLSICFRGWHPRDADADFIDAPKKSGIISQRKSLKVNEDARQQELALKFWWHVQSWSLACFRTDAGNLSIIECNLPTGLSESGLQRLGNHYMTTPKKTVQRPLHIAVASHPQH
ncbi:ribosome 60S biogenesis N-terminal-domain-containing protein [Suillus occidentalis]|nr:ribosome 60S biogenesis N-terminal-domain-containing protein [Suillus occidentalis]